jgi:O-antigen/teichoic acid export membrane protein
MNLRSQVFVASRWVAISTTSGVVLQMLQTVILARILLPADFGLMAIATAVISVLLLIVDLGFSQALIHFDNTSREEQSSLFWMNLLLAIVLMLLLIILAPMLGDLYQSAKLVTLLCWISLIFPITAAGQQLRALGERDLRFDIISTNTLASILAGLVCACISALLNAGVYALVAGLLVKTCIDSILAWVRLPYSYRPTTHFKLTDIKPFWSFSAYLVGESLSNIINRNADIFLGGLAVGAERIGFYSIPRGLTLNSAMIINSIVTRVGFPVMSRVKSEQEKLKSIFLQTLRMTASINFPLYVTLGLFASEIIRLLYGSQWHEAAIYLRILAVWGLVRSMGNPVGSLIYACGQTRRAFWWNISLLILIPPLLWFAAYKGGLLGLSYAMLTLSLGVFVPAWRLLVYPCCGATLTEYGKQFAVPLVCALLAGVVACLVAQSLPSGILRLATGCTAGGIVYLGLSWLLNKNWVLAMLELLHIQTPS